MENLREIMYAIARFMDKPRNPAYAMMELADAIQKYNSEAQKDFEEAEDIIHDHASIEAENEEMRRLLLKHGITYRGKEDAA